MAASEPTSEVAPGVYRFGSERVNWYLVETGGTTTIVDTGFPSHWDQLLEHVSSGDRAMSDIDACLLTHAHPDHIGFAARLHDETGVPVYLHHAGVERARAGGEPPRGMVTQLWRPAILRYFVEVVRSGGTSVPPVTNVQTFDDPDVLDVPGTPRPLHVPGHTRGQTMYYFPDHRVLFSGDAIVTVDITSWRGDEPQLFPAWINEDHEQARESLANVESLGRVTMLPGHGDPWRGEISEAITLARQ